MEGVQDFSIFPVGEGAALVEFGQDILPEIHSAVYQFVSALEKKPFYGFNEVVVAFTSATVLYDIVKVKAAAKGDHRLAFEIVADKLSTIAADRKHTAEQVPRIVEIPVCYGGEYGPDLDFVAQHNKLTVNEVVDIHSQGEYLVYMIGFAPGFPYLGGMSEKIAAPRRTSPRALIPVGAVGIAGKQTGVYPIETPGGWQLIGRTPIKLFRPSDKEPSLLAAGDIVRFYPISSKEYEAYKEGDNK